MASESSVDGNSTSKDAGSKPAGRRKAAARPGQSKSARSKRAEPEKNEPSKAETPKPKRSLPAFGFAGDLLKKKDDAGDSEESSAASDSTADDAEEGAARAVTERVAASVDKDLQDLKNDLTAGSSVDDGEADPHRLFSFADQLQSRQDRQDKDKGPEAKWETWVTFSLNDETFALPVEPVRQVVRVSNITRVPHAPRPVRGVTNLRGRVIPVIDLRMRVGLDPSEITRQSRVVAVASRGRLLGLLVDAVHQVVHLDLNQVQPPPEDVMTIQSDYILGVYHQDESLILLLDVDRALVLREEAA